MKLNARKYINLKGCMVINVSCTFGVAPYNVQNKLSNWLLMTWTKLLFLPVTNWTTSNGFQCILENPKII